MVSVKECVVGSFIQKGIDPYHSAAKIGIRTRKIDSLSEDEIFQYIQPLVNNCNRHGTLLIIVYDALPDSFVQKYTSSLLKFEKIDCEYEVGNYERRIFLFRDFLRSSTIQRVWFADVNDAGFNENPFGWFDHAVPDPKLLIIGEEWTQYGKSKWFEDMLQYCPEKYYDNLLIENADKYPVSLALFGGAYAVVLEFLEKMCASIVEVLDYLKKRPPAYHIMIDMQACGYVVMTEFQNRYWPFKMDGSSYSKGYRSPLLHGVEIVNDFNDNYEVRSKKRPHVEGWCTDEKSKLMTDLVRKVRPNLCVEIGVFGGKSLIPIAQCIKDEDLECVIYGIDPWSTHFCLEYMEHPTQIAWWSNEDLLSHYVRLCETLTSTRLWEQVRLLCAPSHTVVNTFYNESIDIIHIDGNHEVIPSSRDVKLYLPKVKHKGYIWMDDANWATLQPAISIIKEECDLVIDKKDYQLYQKR